MTLWTNDPELARHADAAGVDRIGVDLETIGKAERQRPVGHCWISDHQESDLIALARVVRRGKLFARTNPIHAGSADEIERLLGLGATCLMLPMFRTVREAALFVELVAGRAEVSLLVEHVDAASHIDELVRLEGVDEIYVGLNDLAISLHVPNRFSILGLPLMTTLARAVRARGLRFGFGGLGRFSDKGLPIPTDLIYAECARLGADSALLSQVFLRKEGPTLALAADVRELRERMDHWYAATPSQLAAAHEALLEAIAPCAARRV